MFGNVSTNTNFLITIYQILFFVRYIDIQSIFMIFNVEENNAELNQHSFKKHDVMFASISNPVFNFFLSDNRRIVES